MYLCALYGSQFLPFTPLNGLQQPRWIVHCAARTISLMHINQPQDSIQKAHTHTHTHAHTHTRTLTNARARARAICTQSLRIRQFPAFQPAINYYNSWNVISFSTFDGIHPFVYEIIGNLYCTVKDNNALLKRRYHTQIHICWCYQRPNISTHRINNIKQFIVSNNAQQRCVFRST